MKKKTDLGFLRYLVSREYGEQTKIQVNLAIATALLATLFVTMAEGIQYALVDIRGYPPRVAILFKLEILAILAVFFFIFSAYYYYNKNIKNAIMPAIPHAGKENILKQK